MEGIRTIGSITKSALAKILTFRYGYPLMQAESIAEDFLREDLPNNRITAWAGLISYLDYIDNIRGKAAQ